MTKKVFSKEKFIQWCKEMGKENVNISFNLESWGNRCEGLTKLEMLEKENCLTIDEWMIEVENE